MDTSLTLAIVIPFVLLDSGMKIFSTFNILKTSDMRTQSNLIIWIILIWILSMLGWLSYLLFGRMPVEKKTDDESWD